MRESVKAVRATAPLLFSQAIIWFNRVVRDYVIIFISTRRRCLFFARFPAAPSNFRT